MARVQTTIQGGSGLPTVRLTPAATPRQQFTVPNASSASSANIARGLSAFADEMAKMEAEAQKTTNTALLLETQRRLGQWLIDTEAAYKDPRKGTLGRDANANWVDKASKDYNKFTSQLFSDPRFGELDGVGQMAVREYAQTKALSYRRGLQAHRLEQQQSAVLVEIEANKQLLRDDIAKNPTQTGPKFQQLASYIAQQLNAQGLDDPAVLEANIQGEFTTAIQLTTENLIDAKKPDLARAFLAAHTTIKVPGVGDVDMLADKVIDLTNAIDEAEEDFKAEDIGAELARTGSHTAAERAAKGRDLTPSLRAKALQVARRIISGARADRKEWRAENLRRLGQMAAAGQEITPTQMRSLSAAGQDEIRRIQRNRLLRQMSPMMVDSPFSMGKIVAMTDREAYTLWKKFSDGDPDATLEWESIITGLTAETQQTVYARVKVGAEEAQRAGDQAAVDAASALDKVRTEAEQANDAVYNTVKETVKDLIGQRTYIKGSGKKLFAAATLAAQAAVNKRVEHYQRLNKAATTADAINFMSQDEMRQIVSSAIQSVSKPGEIADNPTDLARSLSSRFAELTGTSADSPLTKTYRVWSNANPEMTPGITLDMYQDYFADPEGKVGEYDPFKLNEMMSKMTTTPVPEGEESDRIAREIIRVTGATTVTADQIRRYYTKMLFKAYDPRLFLNWLKPKVPMTGRVVRPDTTAEAAAGINPGETLEDYQERTGLPRQN